MTKFTLKIISCRSRLMESGFVARGVMQVSSVVRTVIGQGMRLNKVQSLGFEIISANHAY